MESEREITRQVLECYYKVMNRVTWIIHSCYSYAIPAYLHGSLKRFVFAYVQMVYILHQNHWDTWASRSARQIASFATKKSRVQISPCPLIPLPSSPILKINKPPIGKILFRSDNCVTLLANINTIYKS